MQLTGEPSEKAIRSILDKGGLYEKWTYSDKLKTFTFWVVSEIDQSTNGTNILYGNTAQI